LSLATVATVATAEVLAAFVIELFLFWGFDKELLRSHRRATDVFSFVA
jgi:hypothetical protein